MNTSIYALVVLVLLSFTTPSIGQSFESTRFRGNFYRNDLLDITEANKQVNFTFASQNDNGNGRTLMLSLSTDNICKCSIGRWDKDIQSSSGFFFSVGLVSIIEYIEAPFSQEGLDEKDEIIRILPLSGPGVSFLDVIEYSGTNNDMNYYQYQTYYTSNHPQLKGTVNLEVGLSDLRGWSHATNATYSSNAWHWRFHLTDYNYANETSRIAVKLLFSNFGRYIR
jgi:hypothetical protein